MADKKFYPRNARKPRDIQYPKVTAKVSLDEDQSYISTYNRLIQGLSTIAAKFPFDFYEILNQLTLVDPYMSKFVQTTISLGNTGHTIEIDAPTEARADEAILIANDLAMRCFPLSGGLDGLVNALLSQVARSGGVCAEWVPDPTLSMIEEAFVIPIKTIRFRRDEGGRLELCQSQGGQIVPLNPYQTTFHAATIFDGNPYPVPPALAALESCSIHRSVLSQVKAWMEKVAAFGVLLAEVEPPPREARESQSAYDAKAQGYLDKIADSIADNLTQGIGVGYNNIKFNFQNTSASAHGAREILQVVLQGLFAALHRDPIFFGWNFSQTETFSRVVYEEMMQGIRAYQLGVKRALEHGHRLNLALNGMMDVGISVQFKTGRSIDAFRDAEAEYMEAQSVIAQVEAQIIDLSEARKLLGHDDKTPSVGQYTATFNKKEQRYIIQKSTKVWAFNQDNLFQSNESYTYEAQIRNVLDNATDRGAEAFWAWLSVGWHDTWTEQYFVDTGLGVLVEATEGAVDTEKIHALADEYLGDVWQASKQDPTLWRDVKKPDDLTGLTPDEAAGLAYLAAMVEPWFCENFLSNSVSRTERIKSFLRDQYKTLRAGDDSVTTLARIKSALKGLLKDISKLTSAHIAGAGEARAKNWAAVYALGEADITDFVVDGPRDDRKCAYCWGMLDRVFAVKIELAKMKRAVTSQATDYMNVLRPLKDRYGPDELQNASEAEIQRTGLAAPPYHVFCRDYLRAVRRNER